MRWKSSFLAKAFGVVAVALILSAVADANASAAVRAGVASVNITPDRPPLPVRDPLMAKALVVDDGNNKVVIICMDLVEATDKITKDVRGALQRELGIDPSCVLVNAAHNHRSGELDDAGEISRRGEELTKRIVGAVKQASQQMVPVRIGAGVGHEDRITMNRRLRMKDGTHWTVRHATPSPADADVVGLGPMDPQIGLLRVDTMDGKPLALVYNFAGHVYGGLPEGGITADFPGFASGVIEKAWPGATALFLQGAAGDTTPVRFKDFESPPPTVELGTKLGLSALQAAQNITTSDKAVVRVVRETIELPRRTDAAQRIQKLLAEHENLLQSMVPLNRGPYSGNRSLNIKSFLALQAKYAFAAQYPSAGADMYQDEEATGQNGLRHLDEENKKRIDAYRQDCEKMDRLITIRTNLAILYDQLDKMGNGPIPADVQAVRIGDFVVVTFPGEAFAEIGLRIKKKSPFPHTFIAGYTDGELVGDYAPTADDYGKQAYEDSYTQLAPEWGDIYVQKALEMIGRLR
jgi:hypothetical protein